RDILRKESFDNGVVAVMALGGSTNALIHLVAMAGRAGVKLPLERFNEFSAKTPLLANVRPSGDKYLMEDFYYAGGLRALISELKDLLHLDCRTVNGKTLGKNLEGSRIFNEEVIRKTTNPLKDAGGLVMLPVPKKLLKQGVRDMVRISDARMSGTSYGTCVLHVAPESFVGGPLALVKSGDLIELDVDRRELNLKVDAAELARRKSAWRQPERKF